jgi:hypothetical protein
MERLGMGHRRAVPGTLGDLHGNFRTIYAGPSLLACLLEVLAHFRNDARLSMELDEIVEDDKDKVLHPTIAPGQVPKEWLDVRTAASAELSGRYCAVTDSGSVAALYPHFIGLALSLGLADFDAAALKDARPRRLTQAVAAWLYEITDFGILRSAVSPRVWARLVWTRLMPSSLVVKLCGRMAAVSSYLARPGCTTAVITPRSVIGYADSGVAGLLALGTADLRRVRSPDCVQGNVEQFPLA